MSFAPRRYMDVSGAHQNHTRSRPNRRTDSHTSPHTTTTTSDQSLQYPPIIQPRLPNNIIGIVRRELPASIPTPQGDIALPAEARAEWNINPRHSSERDMPHNPRPHFHPKKKGGVAAAVLERRPHPLRKNGPRRLRRP